MSNLIRRNNNPVEPRNEGVTLDPFRMMSALLRWDPFRSLADEGWVSPVSEFSARFDLKETKDAYLAKVDLPGVKEEDVEIAVAGNVLTISGRREQESRDEGDQYFAMERSYGTFSRALSLPSGADLEHVTADLKNGVLTVHVPKKPEIQPRKIAIGSGDKVKA